MSGHLVVMVLLTIHQTTDLGASDSIPAGRSPRILSRLTRRGCKTSAFCVKLFRAEKTARRSMLGSLFYPDILWSSCGQVPLAIYYYHHRGHV